MAGSVTPKVSADDACSLRVPLVLLWSFGTLVWSVFTPPHLTFAARILIFQPLWALRIYVGDRTWTQDLLIFQVLHFLYSYAIGAWRLPTADDFWWLDLHNHVFMLYVKIFSLLGVCGALAGGIVHRGSQLKTGNSEAVSDGDRIDEQLLPPLLLASRTSHSRIFPKKHAFSYSYLFAGVPVGGFGRISSALSIDSVYRSWFHVDAADYLTRSKSSLGLGEKLKRYLQTQNVTDREYSFAYLVTAPRFLGYSFNPVSFWYLYDSDTKLKYMILEVNNTFDERRIYFLRADNATKSARSATVDQTEKGSSLVYNFTNAWLKDFHVSPFNDREGSYSLRAVDPLAAYQETGKIKIDNTIVLLSSQMQPKIVARVWSEAAPVEADAVTNLQLARFIMSWWWVGLFTFPRIVWEAQKLFFSKRLHVWYRPEVTSASIGRDYTEDERMLEQFFRVWLTNVLEHAQDPLRVVYEPAHHDDEEIVLYSPGFTYEEDSLKTLTLKVLSPGFYSRFIHYAHASEAFDRECLATEDKNRTLGIEGAHLLPVFLRAIRADITNAAPHRINSTSLETWRWFCLQCLRCPPPAASYPPTGNRDYHGADIRTFGYSELDIFVWNSFGIPDASVYRCIATKLFLAHRIALGIPMLIAGLDRLVRGTFVLSTLFYCRDFDVGDVFRPRSFQKCDIGTFAVALSLANSIHLWEIVKR